MTDIRPFDPALFGDAAIDPDTANLNAQMGNGLPVAINSAEGPMRT